MKRVENAKEGPLTVADNRSALQSLVNTLIDASRGLESLQERGTPTLTRHAEKFASLHAKHLTELEAIMRNNSGSPDMSGTLFGHVQEAVVALRDLFAGLDTDALQPLLDGEARILSYYDSTLDELDTGHPARPALRDQRAELEQRLSELEQHISAQA
ncbi:DUF2383 domain-containing protein [Primorskyibacter sp. S187A]|uniref:DUF2383 domain-containing protein n=1 Tax=Primorskyibacter sp. S187A TaxID=3415130 RepID=UPI003C7BD0A5